MGRRSFTKFLFLAFCLLDKSGAEFGWSGPRQFVVDGQHGDDANSGQGTDQAFKTIIRSMEEVIEEGGDCLIREGAYHEQLVISGVKDTPNPVRIMGYEDERPVWDGTYPIKPEAWELNQDTGACSTTLDKNITALFLDRDLLTPARWPNALWSDKTVFMVDHWRPEADGSDRGVVVDPELANSGLDMTGAMAILNIGAWITFVAKVDDHGKGNDHFIYNDTFGDISFHVKHNSYYLEGTRTLLDAPEEWHFDPKTMMLQVIPPKGKNCQDLTNLRGRTVDYGLSITDSTNIAISNMTFFGATINVHGKKNKSVDNIHLDSIQFLFPTSSHRMLGEALEPLATSFLSDQGTVSVTNCTFHGSDGPGLKVEAIKPFISNNLFTYNDWAAQGYRGTTTQGSAAAALQTTSVDAKISYNTFLFNGAGNSIRTHQGVRDEIFMNEIQGTCWGEIQRDGSAIQIPSGCQPGVNVHHNWFHDSPKLALRFDGSRDPGKLGNSGYMGFNLAWDTSLGSSKIFVKGDNHTVEHNTVLHGKPVLDNCTLCVLKDYHGNPVNMHTDVLNNAANKMDQGGGLIQDNFVGEGLAGFLVDPENRDFRPKAGSPLDLSSGGYIGAYGVDEETYWIPGRRETMPTMPIPKDGGILARGLGGEGVLIYKPAYKAVSHHLYLGTHRQLVEEAAENEPPFQFSTEGDRNMFPLKKTNLMVEEGQQYFWRVDAKREDGTRVKGHVWTFIA